MRTKLSHLIDECWNVGMFISLRLYVQEPYQTECKDLIKWYDKEKQQVIEKTDTNLRKT